jgi:hypothetical protein
MSEQPKRKEAWSIYTGEGECLGDFETEDAALDVVNEQRGDFVVHRVELRDGESIIGPEERAVIEAAIKLNWLNTKHDATNARVLGAKTPSEVSEAIDDRHALIKMRPKIEAEFAAAVGALKKAERNG